MRKDHLRLKEHWERMEDRKCARNLRKAPYHFPISVKRTQERERQRRLRQMAARAAKAAGEQEALNSGLLRALARG